MFLWKTQHLIMPLTAKVLQKEGGAGEQLRLPDSRQSRSRQAGSCLPGPRGPEETPITWPVCPTPCGQREAGLAQGSSVTSWAARRWLGEDGGCDFKPFSTWNRALICVWQEAPCVPQDTLPALGPGLLTRAPVISLPACPTGCRSSLWASLQTPLVNGTDPSPPASRRSQT